MECFLRGALIKDQSLSCDGISVRVGIWSGQAKSEESSKLVNVWPLFGFYVLFVVIGRRACILIKESRLRICHLE